LRPQRSLTLRLTLLFALLASAVLAVFSAVILSAIAQHFVEQDRDLLEGKFARIQTQLAQIHAPAGLDTLHVRLHELLVGHQDMLALVVDATGRVWLSMPAGAAVRTHLQAAIDADRRLPFSTTFDERPFRVMTAKLSTGIEGAGPLGVALAIDIEHHARFMSRFRRTLLLLGVAAALASGLLGWLVARRGLAPLRQMGEQTARVTAARLDQRLPEDSVPQELAELAASLNAMLGRLEDAFARLSAFSSDLAHELRTPISNLMTQTQVALSMDRDAATYRDTLGSNAEELERMARMVADMLFLAKADHGLMLPSAERVDLAREVRELFDYYDALAEDAGVTLTLLGEGQVTGDRLMLRRALNNLLSNALRHTPCGGGITVGILSSAHETLLRVENTGTPIAEDDLPHLFDRFYRADKSRTHDAAEGSGLGLAITRAVVEAHGGRIGVASDVVSTRFELRLPTDDVAGA